MTSKTPCIKPHRMKVRPAPCQMPDSAIVTTVGNATKAANALTDLPERDSTGLPLAMRDRVRCITRGV